MAIYYTADEVAQELRVNRRTVYEWLRTGRLRGVRAGKSWRVGREDLDAFLGATSALWEMAAPRPDALEPLDIPRPANVFVVQAPFDVPEGEVIDAEQAKKNQAAIELLDSWMKEGDEEEQRETWEYLRRVLDEDRLSYRKLFP